MSKRVAFKVHGTVQGVGFRDFTQKCATSYGLLGWVEGEAQGDEEIVQKFLAQVDRGPRLAHVVKLETRELELTRDEDHFAVMRTMESMFKPGS